MPETIIHNPTPHAPLLTDHSSPWSENIILPGQTIGILGSGQLGRMLALEARKMGYRVETLSPEKNSPTGQIATLEHVADYSDLTAIQSFARNVDVITFEFENVPSMAAEVAREFVPIRPSGNVLHIAQHRLREKTFLSGIGVPVTPFRYVRTAAELEAAVSELGYPCVLKSAGFGYDGKGQSKLLSPEDLVHASSPLRHAAHHHSSDDAVLEAYVDFEMELSVIAARGLDGSFAHFAVCENIHRHHILDVTIAPARIAPEVAHRAIAIARKIMEELDCVGVLVTELFLTKDGGLLVNETAPRPHNSGHFTFDACMTSQFGQQLRAICGLPLGSTEQFRPAVMVQLLGELWHNGEPNWRAALDIPGVALHLYGKTEPRHGRKMGHITAMAGTIDESLERALEARYLLTA